MMLDSGGVDVVLQGLGDDHDVLGHAGRPGGQGAPGLAQVEQDGPRPGEMSNFAQVGAILLHLREPWGALSQAARMTKDVMIVTEPLQDDVDPPECPTSCASHPRPSTTSPTGGRSTGTVVSMLTQLLQPHRDGPSTRSATSSRTTWTATPSTSPCTPWWAGGPDHTGSGAPGRARAQKIPASPAPRHHRIEELGVAGDQHRPLEVGVHVVAPPLPEHGPQHRVTHEPGAHGPRTRGTR